MTQVRVLLARLRGLFVRRRLDADLQQEIASHLDEAIDEYRHQGLSPSEARRAALRSFGGVTQAIEIHRDARGWPALESLVRDLRRALRLLRRSPAVTTAAILSLALGMGGTTTMFSLMNGLMPRPLPVVEPDRLVSIATSDGNGAWRLQCLRAFSGCWRWCWPRSGPTA